MELPLIRALLFVKLSLFALWNPSLSLQTRGDSPLQDYNDENVIDLLEALNVTRSVRGVTKVKGRDPGVPAWRFRSRAPHLTLPRDFSRYFVSSAHGAMGLHLIGRQSQGSEATLISLVSPGDGSHAPLLSLTSSTRSDWLRLEYRAEGGQGEMTFPGGSPFSGGGWVQLAFSLEPHRVLLYVDCREAVLWSDGQEQLRLQLPQDLLITFSSTAGERGSKFSGYWQTAEISTRAYLKRPWHCDNVTDPLPLPPPTQKAEVLEVEDADAPSMLLEDADSPSMPLEERAGVANDQPQRGGVLGPPSPAHREPHPQREPPPPGGPEQRISRLEELLEGMGTMLDMLKTQNVELQERVRYLESCECVRRTCEWEGREVAAGSRWVIDGRTVCTCTSGQVQCSASQDPCSSTPCLNGGVCLVTTFDPGFRCSAPSEVTGSRQLSQACFLPKLEGVVCRGGKAEPEQRWFFDSASASCEHFLFGGCGGNRNSFPTRRACQVQCMLGACCSRPLADHTQEGDHRHGHDQHGDSRHGYEQHRDSRHGYEQHGDSRHGCEQHRDGGNGSNASEPECSARMGEEPHEWKRLGPSDGRQSVGKARRGSPGGVGFNRTRRGWQCEGGGARTVGSLQAMPGGASPAGMGAGGAAAAELSCEYMWAGQCQLRARAREVLSFSPGRGCAEVACGLRGGCRGDDLRGCVVSGRSYRPGESFTLGCDACVCTGTGALRCTCPLPTQRKELRDLSQSERQEYQRAVRQLRPECSFEGKTYRNDEVFNPDPCSSCVCEYGTMQCKEVQCSSLSCLDQFVPKGECCPVCQPGCEYENEVYENGEVFVSRSNPCLNCSCTNSLVRCSPIHCPPAPCPNPYKRPGQCCPTCSACDLDGRPYNGSFSTIDGCQTCTCQDGVQQCVEVQQCPMVCADGVRPPFGSCCRDCSRCDLQGEVILDGVSFPDRKDACKRCVCTEGNVVCRGVPCPSLDCSLLETVGGECCPRCRSCVHKGVRHKHGTQWNHPDNPCSNCTCLEGRVRCEREECSPPCKNPPSPRPGACCPVCNDCGVNGLDFLNGKPVPSRDQCEECVCVNGDLHCKPLPCPATPCPQPIRRPGDCCPRCEQCEYESQLYEDGQSFASRLDPCLSCRCAAGEVVCERVDSACPSLRCSHPAKPRGQCCPTCDMCEYERRVYADGKVFNPPGSGPCLQCTCKGGSVRCHQKRCPPVLCSNPINDPQLCCPICKVCVLEGVEFEEGSVWEAESQPCSSCSCVDGNVVCRHAQCPPTACRHPSNAHGECCATCDRCSYNQRIYDNGQTFTDPDEPCQTCTCQDGSVQCNMMQCPAVSCPRPHTPAEQCCPQCPDCDFENRVFVNGEAFPSPVNPCEECVCADGRVDCHGHQCPTAPCHHPLPGSCCLNNCNGCSYAGKEYPNGMEFPHPTDTCRTCHCINGNVQCLMKRCPAQQCSDPRIVPGECCPQCPVPPADCVYEGQTYRHTQRFYHPTDSCQSCSCTNGTVGCRRRPCPPALCAHPLQQECCRTCDGCLYDGREHANGAVFADVSDTCGMCVCREGTVMCERRRCPAITCSFPTHGECCHTCDGCRYVGVEYLSRQEFADPGDQCSVCVCMSGQVTCSPKPCYSPGCSHPVTLHGTCCPVCNGCFYDNVVLLNGQAVPDPSDACSQCTCRAGSVQCVRRVCPVAPCPQPVSGPCDCPVCEGCLFQGGVHLDGESFPAAKSACEECTCSKGEVRCVPRSCPKVTCPHPGVDLCSCAVCDGCRFHGRECVSGERFLDPHDHCQRCTCLNGGVSCVPLSCPAVSCSRPVRRRGECCPVCTGACQHDRQQYQTGSTFTPPSQPCSTCTCLNEVVSCVPVSCPRQCSHPALSKGCCPACHACLYEGSEFTHRQTFSSPSDPCLRCTCLRGSVTCDPVPCPPISCPDPVTPPGHCCRECRVCVQHGVEYGEGQTWSPSNDLCSQCTCMAGVVSCVGPQCPKLSCMHQATEPDSCCPRCRGCVYEGDERAEGSVWFGSSTPCMSCMCVEGVTTCSEVRCLSPCLNHITVPGECCPVCADCIYDDQLYSPGESFHPSADPCQICTCEVMPDGEQHLRCYRKQCPSLVDCPKNNILFSGPDECCPVCAQPLSNCTATLIGNEVLATDDPCFTCQCKDLTWTCIHQACLPLSCPTKEQYTPPDSCCPVCDECVIEGERERVPNGESWTDSVDECITCTCNLGYIECDIEECTPLVCRDGLVKVKSPGQCCYECQDVSCVYQDQVFVSNEHWEVDECTACTCVAGDVHCHTERCPVVSCAADETPALIPGMCCPHCIPRPATCVAFGDPHYRTFDGKMVNFQGACTYVLAQDCEGGDFSIHGTNDDRGRKGVSWTKEVTVFIGDVIVQLLQDWVVMVDYQMVTLPYLREPYIYLERKTNTILLNTNLGLKVLWNGRSHLEISVPGTYKKHMCGLCGNFNSFPQDDTRLRNGHITTSDAAFGNDWKVQSTNRSNTACSDGLNVDPCKEAGYFARKTANARCGVLKSGVFERCHRVVPPEMFFAACVYDLCACGPNSDECVCDALEAYASECREAGVVLQWRSPSLCAVGCPVDRGFVFDECGPPCAVTCFNKEAALGEIEAGCFKPCVPGCQCPAGLVEHEAHCIPPERCPKVIYGNA